MLVNFDACMLLDYLECRAEDGNKLDYPSAFMSQVQRKRISFSKELW